MNDPVTWQSGPPANRAASPGGPNTSANLADILERVLDKGIVIAGDIKINLLDIELLTIKLRLLVASVDKAKEMGIDWWEHDPTLTSSGNGKPELSAENERLRARVVELEEAGTGDEQAAQRQPAADRTEPSSAERADGT